MKKTEYNSEQQLEVDQHLENGLCLESAEIMADVRRGNDTGPFARHRQMLLVEEFYYSVLPKI